MPQCRKHAITAAKLTIIAAITVLAACTNTPPDPLPQSPCACLIVPQQPLELLLRDDGGLHG